MSSFSKPSGALGRRIAALVLVCLLNGCLMGASSLRPEALRTPTGAKYRGEYIDSYHAWARDSSLDMDIRVRALLLLPWRSYSDTYREFAANHDCLDVVRARHGAAAVAHLAEQARTRTDGSASWLTDYLLGSENERAAEMLRELAGQEALRYIQLARTRNYTLSATEVMALARTDDGPTRLYLHRLIGSEDMKELAPFLARQVADYYPLDWVRGEGPDPTLSALDGSMRVAEHGGGASAVGGVMTVGIVAFSFISMTQGAGTLFGPRPSSPEIAAVHALEQLHDGVVADDAVRHPLFRAATRALAVDDGMDWTLAAAVMRFYRNTNTPMTPQSRRAFDVEAATLQRHALHRARAAEPQGWRQAEAILYFLDMAGASFDRNSAATLAAMTARCFEAEDALFETLSDGRKALYSAATLVENTRLEPPGLHSEKMDKLWAHAHERNDIALFVIGLTLAPDQERESEFIDYLRGIGAAITAGESRQIGYVSESAWLQAVEKYQLFDAMPAVAYLLHSGNTKTSQLAWELLSARGAEALPHILTELDKPAVRWRLSSEVEDALLAYLVAHLTHEELRELAAQSRPRGNLRQRLREYMEAL